MKNIILTLFLLCPVCLQGQKVINNDKNSTIIRSGNKIHFQWEYKEGNTSYFPKFNFYVYSGWEYMQKVYSRLDHSHGDYTRFIRDDPFKNDLITLAKCLREIANLAELNEVELALSFVQSLPYQSGMGGYQRYGVETLIDGRGDCSDTSALFAGILAAWNYDCIFLRFPNHLAVGIWNEEIPGGSYYEHRNRKFYYCETTGTSFSIGECPDEYGSAKVQDVSFY